jgi:hypothetical protein
MRAPVSNGRGFLWPSICYLRPAFFFSEIVIYFGGNLIAFIGLIEKGLAGNAIACLAGQTPCVVSPPTVLVCCIFQFGHSLALHLKRERPTNIGCSCN